MASSGSNRVIRGGSWNNDAQNLRSANRNNNDPGNRNDNLGFRLESTKVCQLSAVHGLHFRASGFVQAITQCHHSSLEWRTNNNGITASGRGQPSKAAVIQIPSAETILQSRSYPSECGELS